MLSLRTIRRPFTGNFQTAVRTVLPFHVTSRGRPAFTERRRGISTFSKFGAWLDSFYFTTVHSDGGTRHPFRSRGHHEREQIGDLFRSSIATDPYFSWELLRGLFDAHVVHRCPLLHEGAPSSCHHGPGNNAID